MKIEIKYIIAQTDDQFNDAITLFQEYASSLPISLDFQHFGEELKIIRSMYGVPEGLLVIAYESKIPIACAAYRKIEPNVCEVKRMYVKPAYRKKQIGDSLLGILLRQASDNGYLSVKLDTLDTMIPAISLYKKHGFGEIDAYYYNPNLNTVYMEKVLGN